MSINENLKSKRPDIGGQAVLEGVMMKAPEQIAVAVRRPNGDIVVKRDEYVSIAKKHPWMGKPFIRGAVNFIAMLELAKEGLVLISQDEAYAPIYVRQAMVPRRDSAAGEA